MFPILLKYSSNVFKDFDYLNSSSTFSGFLWNHRRKRFLNWKLSLCCWSGITIMNAQLYITQNRGKVQLTQGPFNCNTGCNHFPNARSITPLPIQPISCHTELPTDAETSSSPICITSETWLATFRFENNLSESLFVLPVWSTIPGVRKTKGILPLPFSSARYLFSRKYWTLWSKRTGRPVLLGVQSFSGSSPFQGVGVVETNVLLLYAFS